MAREPIRSHRELEVYQLAMKAAMRIFEISKDFPVEERYTLTDQVRRSSRSVCTNIAEAWRKRRYANAFAAKLNDAEAEAAETQSWIEFAVNCSYITPSLADELTGEYDAILGKSVSMITNPAPWLLSAKSKRAAS